MDQPALPAFEALGANFKGKRQNCCKVTADAILGTFHALRVVIAQGHFELTAGVTRQNFLVNAGVVAFDAGRVVYKYMQDSIDQLLPAEALRAAIQQVEPSTASS